MQDQFVQGLDARITRRSALQGAAAIGAAACRIPLRTNSAVVLAASVITSSAPRPGQGGVDQSGLRKTKSKNP